MPALRRVAPWLGGGVALAVANAWMVSADVGQFDESWTLQVVHRLAEGDSLYGDIHFTVTPLSIYLLAAVVGLLGEEILVVKAIAALLAAGSALLVARICLQAGVSRFGAGACALLTLPLAPAFPLALYTPLAMLLFLACETLTLTALTRQRSGWFVAAGACAGLAFSAKQNVGGLAILAVAAAVLVAEPRRAAVRRALVSVAAFAAVAGASILSMIATGGVRRTLDALGLAKGAYLAHGAVPYDDALVSHLRSLARPTAWRDVIAGRDRDLVIASPRTVLPVVAALVITAAWVSWRTSSPDSRKLDAPLAAVALFAAASFASAFPRYDAVHLAWAAGPILAGCAAGLTRVLPTPGRAARAAIVAVGGAWVVFALLGPLADWRSGRVRVGLPHFAGAWTSGAGHDAAVTGVRGFREWAPGRRVFIVAANASFYYLAAGLENPTRFDYPAQSSIGGREVEEIMNDVAGGEVPVACLLDGTPNAGELRVLELERRLRHVMRPGTDIGLCRLWTTT